MFVTKNQFFIFLACVVFGAVSGILFSILRLLTVKIKSKGFKSIFDCVFFLISACGMIAYSYYFNFPSIRAYMIAGDFLGLFLYVKSFHLTLAKVLKMAYNNIKGKRSNTKDDRVKV